MTAPRLLRCLAPCLLLFVTTSAAAKTSWISVKDLAGAGEVCLEIDGRQFRYTRLGPGDQASCTLHGPRRLKLTSRYVFDDQDESRVPYTLIVAVDGREVLRKGFTGKPLASAAACGNSGRVGSLRRGYVDLPAGSHEVTIRAEREGRGRVAVRLFRQVKRVRERWVTFAPESYDEVRNLQFESGSQSTYYHFDATTPLHFSVNGPTTLRLGTRLDFDHLMNGSQTYALDVLIDDVLWRSFHFDAAKLTTAVYLERPDILPGDRKEFRVTVPRGRHEVTVRCMRPERCGVAAMIHIPKSDLER